MKDTSATSLAEIDPLPSAGAASASILIVDDEEIIRTTFAEFLAGEGFHAASASSAEEALELVRRRAFHVAICDVQLPGLDGIELLDRLVKIRPELFVLLITAYATVESAVEALKAGAHDYLMKPVRFDDLLMRIHHLLRYRKLFLENQRLRRELARQSRFDEIIGSSQAMHDLLSSVRKVARTRSNVLLVGESGTGKELVARALHAASGVADKKFIAVNCAAIPAELLENQLFGHRRGAFTGADRDEPGLFVNVGDGTLFLDEVAEIPYPIQAKLLRAIEQKEILPVGAAEPIRVNPRIVAATNRDLEAAMHEGRFREDLYYRLDVVTLHVPPLRERTEDVPELVEFFLAKHTSRIGKRIKAVSDHALRVLIYWPWKGNVRELDNAIERAVIMCEGEVIQPHDLPPHFADNDRVPDTGDDLRTATRHFERLHIQRVLARCPDKREAARRLGLGLSSLYRKIDELDVEV